MQSKIKLKPSQTMVFIGDSITDADRDHPAYRPFGFGYVHFVAYLLLARYPHYNLNIINTGVGGNTIRDLKDRWEKDCIAHRPDVLSVLIGINDLWWWHAESQGFAEGLCPEEYELTYKQLLSQVKAQCNCQLVLMEPFMFCNEPENQMFKGLRTYMGIVHELADEFNAVIVPLQNSVDRQIRNVPPEKWSVDSVHPYVWAHAWIAERWLEATGL
ncbi:MAG: SGNH/GDSL hydrolase family protein [Planctomycetota bacterium]